MHESNFGAAREGGRSKAVDNQKGAPSETEFAKNGPRKRKAGNEMKQWITHAQTARCLVSTDLRSRSYTTEPNG
jgi:hypothetical protein